MTQPSSKVICHSRAPNGEELITLEIEMHRFVLPEFNTHRVCSRNFQSSRAVPTQKLLDQIKSVPAMPVFWGANQSGMIADNELPEDIRQLCENIWKEAAQSAARYATQLHNLNCHKQIVNRLLEPFMWTKGVVTATREAYEGFFLLRSHYAAQPEIKALSDAMKASIEGSTPNDLSYGGYHLPYVDNDLILNIHGKRRNISNLVKVSTSCNAQVSYRVLDDSLEKAVKIYEMLNLPKNGVYPEDPPHFSPTEHVAKVVKDYEYEEFMGGNFATGTFWQYRKSLESGTEELFLEVA